MLTSAMSRVLIAVSALILATAVGAQSPRANLGVLTCTLGEQGEAQGTPVGEGRAMRCVFKPTVGGAEEAFSGLIRKVAQGQIPSGKLVMIWVVQGPGGGKNDPACWNKPILPRRKAAVQAAHLSVSATPRSCCRQSLRTADRPVFR